MSLINTLINTWTGPKRKAGKVSLESKQTGSCGGMSSTELKIRIELILDGVDTRQIIEPVTQLAALSHALQSEFLGHLKTIADKSGSHAYSLMLVYTSALNLMTTAEHGYWLERIKKAIQEKEFEHANTLILRYEDHVSPFDKETVQLTDIYQIIERLISTISQDELTVTQIDMSKSSRAYTDGKQLFLPPAINHFDNYADNYLLYRVMTFQLLSQIECNTRQAVDKVDEGIANKGKQFLDTFSFFETLRFNHYIKEAFPGIWKNILYLHLKLGFMPYPESFFSDFEQTTVFDSLALIEKTDIQIPFSQPLPYQCDFSPAILRLTQSQEDKKQAILMNLFEDQFDASEGELTDNEKADRISLRHNSNATSPNNLPKKHSDIWEQLNETLVVHHEKMERLREDEKQNRVFFYPEWDTSLKKYRPDWCRVQELALAADEDEAQSLNIKELRFAEYQIKKTLDRIINTQRFVRYQNDGDEIDIDAWVEAISNKTKHAEDFQKVYIRNNKHSRSVAIMFAVDISGSTSGWKNVIIQQSIWLLSQTLSKLDDQYAIYAFSGSGRKQCNIYPVKQFDEKYSNTIKKRITQLSAKQYTRMGAAIRHLSHVLNQTEAKTKILFVLTDGRPDDIDSYRGHYGVEDTRRAFNEAKALSLNPFVLTFDQESIDYLPHMLGKKNYRLISDISMLPVQISSIYRELTT